MPAVPIDCNDRITGRSGSVRADLTPVLSAEYSLAHSSSVDQGRLPPWCSYCGVWVVGCSCATGSSHRGREGGSMTRKKQKAGAAASATVPDKPRCKGCKVTMQGRADYCVGCYRERLRRCTNCTDWIFRVPRRIPQALRLRQGQPCPVCNDDGYFVSTKGEEK